MVMFRSVLEIDLENEEIDENEDPVIEGWVIPDDPEAWE